MKISQLIKDKQLLKRIFPFNVTTDYLSINPKNNVLEERFGFHSSTEIQKRIKNILNLITPNQRPVLNCN